MPLSPSNSHHSETLSYTASDNIQLIIFSGPLKPEENNKVNETYSPDNGKTKYESKIVDLANRIGTFTFSSNRLAIYSPTETFYCKFCLI